MRFLEFVGILGFPICWSIPLIIGITSVNSALKPSVLSCNRVDSPYIECEFTSAGVLFAKKTKISPLISARYQIVKWDDEPDNHLFILNTPNKAIPIEVEIEGTEILKEVVKINLFIADLNKKTFFIGKDNALQSFQGVCSIIFVIVISFLSGGVIIVYTIGMFITR
jgi:hypothetical protein